MKVSIETSPAQTETQVIIRCQVTAPDAQRLIAFIQASDKKLIGYTGSAVHFLSPSDVFYCESVDDKVFIYLQNQVLESRQKLYEIEAETADSQLFRAAKSLIVNLGKIKSVRPLLDGRFAAELHNGEQVIISRQYVPLLKRKLGL